MTEIYIHGDEELDTCSYTSETGISLTSVIRQSLLEALERNKARVST
jgi:hypothetical protein